MENKKKKSSFIILQEKIKNLKEEFLKTKEKINLYGAKDSSENSDWILLNDKLMLYKDKIFQLEVKLSSCKINNDKFVTYLSLENGEKKTIQLTNGEADPDKGIISRESPFGIDLSDKNKGEIFEFKMDKKKYQILDIKDGK